MGDVAFCIEGCSAEKLPFLRRRSGPVMCRPFFHAQTHTLNCYSRWLWHVWSQNLADRLSPLGGNFTGVLTFPSFQLTPKHQQAFLSMWWRYHVCEQTWWKSHQEVCFTNTHTSAADVLLKWCGVCCCVCVCTQKTIACRKKQPVVETMLTRAGAKYSFTWNNGKNIVLLYTFHCSIWKTTIKLKDN